MGDVTESSGCAFEDARTITDPTTTLIVEILVNVLLTYFLIFFLAPLFGICFTSCRPRSIIVTEMQNGTRRAPGDYLNDESGVHLTTNVASTIQKENEL